MLVAWSSQQVIFLKRSSLNDSISLDDDDDCDGSSEEVKTTKSDGNNGPLLIETLNKVFKALLQVANGQSELLSQMRIMNAKLSAGQSHGASNPSSQPASGNKALAAVAKLSVRLSARSVFH